MDVFHAWYQHTWVSCIKFDNFLVRIHSQRSSTCLFHILLFISRPVKKLGQVENNPTQIDPFISHAKLATHTDPTRINV